MNVGGRGRTQLRHLGRQLIGLTRKQKLQNVLLEKDPYTEWWGDGRSHCKVPGNICMPRGNAKPRTHFSLRILRVLNFFVWDRTLGGVSGPCHLCGPTFSKPLKEGRSFEKITILLWVSLSTFLVTLRKSWLLFLWRYQLLKDKGHALVNIISGCGHAIKKSNEEWKNI